MLAPHNHVPGMVAQKNLFISKFGKDSTGQVQYRFNRQGFRGVDFDFVPSYAFFGASAVFGIGVNENQTFPYLFDKSHNYGLAGQYDNHDTMTVLERFLQSEIYTPTCQIAVVWHSKDSECLADFYDRLRQHTNIIHFYSGQPLARGRCFAMLQQIDQDVSHTHMGPKTHQYMFKTLSALFGKSNGV